MKYFLGIDGGQSSTTALIGDETGWVMGGGRGGPCNHIEGPGGRRKFVDAISECLRQACERAGLDHKTLRFHSVAAGFSGGPADKEALLQEIVPAFTMHVTNDALIALTGATAGAPGIITIAGTGSISYGRNAKRAAARAGGWGYLFGDEGGGFDIVRQALRAAIRHEEGWGPATALIEVLLKATNSASANDALHRLYTTEFPRPTIAAFSKLVDQAAEGGDSVARGILLDAAQQLATLTQAVRGQLFAPGEKASVAYIGGVYRSTLLLNQFRTLVELEGGNRVIAPLLQPAAGALIEAYAAVGLSPELRDVPPAEK